MNDLTARMIERIGEAALLCGLVVFSTPALGQGGCNAPTLMGSYEGSTKDIYSGDGMIVGTTAYLTGRYRIGSSYSGWLRVVDMGDPNSPTLLDTVEIGGSPFGTRAADDVVYVSNRTVGLQIVDFNNGGSMATRNIPGNMYGLAVSNGFAYVTSDSGLHVVDVSDPASPVLVGEYVADGFYPYAIQTDGNFAYAIASFVSGLSRDLYIFDISTPSSPALVSTYALPRGAANLYAADGLVYVVGANNHLDEFSDFEIIDASDPANPLHLSSFESSATTMQNVYVEGTRAYLSNKSFGLVVDISNLANPQLLTHVRVSSNSVQADGAGKLYFLSEDRVRVYDVSGELGGDCPAPCIPDLDASGDLNFFDITAFLSAYQTRDPLIEFNGDGAFNFYELSFYLAAFAAGCP